jgi:hypothetical protein
MSGNLKWGSRIQIDGMDNEDAPQVFEVAVEGTINTVDIKDALQAHLGYTGCVERVDRVNDALVRVVIQYET